MSTTVDVPMMSPAQSRLLHLLLRQRGATGDLRFPVLTEMLGRRVITTKSITRAEARTLIDALDAPTGDDGEPLTKAERAELAEWDGGF